MSIGVYIHNWCACTVRYIHDIVNIQLNVWKFALKGLARVGWLIDNIGHAASIDLGNKCREYYDNRSSEY